MYHEDVPSLAVFIRNTGPFLRCDAFEGINRESVKKKRVIDKRNSWH